jgi:polyisoprenyl-teichoic acid--peptidoglycan teichoic acid transferase
MHRRLLTTAMALFVAGGMAGGLVGIRNLDQLSRTRAAPMPQALAAHPPMRDFDDSPPPFEPAGQADNPTAQPASAGGQMNVLLMGIDQRPDEAAAGDDPGRTDSMLLVSIDFDNRMASMVSIPRDGFVVIPGHGNERVNAAYSFGELDHPGGGPALAERTVEQLFGIRIDHYALVDIHSMEQVIDALGGVWIDNPRRLIDSAYPTDDYRTITIDIPAGKQLMDGVTAVEYARTRHPDSDYGREGRQQQLLVAIRDRALQLDVLPRLPQLLPHVRDLVKTDISLADAIQLANFGRGLDSSQIVRVPPDPNLTPSYTGPGGASYINLTSKYRAMVHAMVSEPRVAAEQAAIDVYNAGAPVGSGGKVATLLGSAGLIVNEVANAPRVATTRIEAGGGARRSAELIAHLLGLSNDSLIVSGDSTDVKVLLGPDAQLPPA